MRAPTQPRLPGVATWATLTDAYLGAYTGHTRSSYRVHLADWARWCADRRLDPLAAQRADVQAYVGALLDRELSPSTISGRRAVLAGAYRLAALDALLERSPVVNVRSPKVASESQTLGLDLIELQALLKAARSAGHLQAALVTLLAFNGLRVSEICAADVGDLVSVRGQRALAITQKGGRRAQAPISTTTAAALDDHLAGRKQGPLLITAAGGRLHRSSAYRIVTSQAKAAGLPPGITPHSLRHTFVTLAREAGVALEDVQDAAGHADPQTTRRYDRARRALDRHPTHALERLLG